MANTAHWIATNFSSRSKRAVVNQYRGAPVHACPDFVMSRENYLWERCGTTRFLSRASELSSVQTWNTEIFNLAVTITAVRIRPKMRCLWKKNSQPSQEARRPHTRPDFRFSRNYFGSLSSAMPGIAEESANIRRGIFIISDNQGGEGRLAPSKAWFIARIRDLNCRATRGTDGTRSNDPSKFVTSLSKN